MSKTETKPSEETPKEEKKLSKEEQEKQAWEARQNELRMQQGLPEGAVPEQRDHRYQGTPDSAVLQKLREADDPRGMNQPAMGYEEHKKADSDAQKKRADKESAHNARFFAGAKGWVYNPGSPDHGRAVGILRVSEFLSEKDELLDSMQGGRGRAKRYEVETRDGRAEKLFIDAEHFRPAANEAEWGKTPIMTPIPDGS